MPLVSTIRTSDYCTMLGHLWSILAFYLLWLLPSILGWPANLLFIHRRENVRSTHSLPHALIIGRPYGRTIGKEKSFRGIALIYYFFWMYSFMSQATDCIRARNTSEVPPSAITLLVYNVHYVLPVHDLNLKYAHSNWLCIACICPFCVLE